MSLYARDMMEHYAENAIKAASFGRVSKIKIITLMYAISRYAAGAMGRPH